MIIKPSNGDWLIPIHRLVVDTDRLLTYVQGDTQAISSAAAASALLDTISARVMTLAEDLGSRAYTAMRKRDWASTSTLHVSSALLPSLVLQIDVPDASAAIGHVVSTSSNLVRDTIQANHPTTLTRRTVSVTRVTGAVVVQTTLSALISKYLQRAALLRGRSENALTTKEVAALDELDAWIESIRLSAGPYLLKAVDMIVVDVSGVYASTYIGPHLEGTADDTSVQLEGTARSTIVEQVLSSWTLGDVYLNSFATHLLSGVSASAFDSPPLLASSAPVARLAPTSRASFILSARETEMLRAEPETLVHLCSSIEQFNTRGVPLTPYQHVNLTYYYTRAVAKLKGVSLAAAPQSDAKYNVSDWASYLSEAGLADHQDAVYAPVILLGDWQLDDHDLGNSARGAHAIRAFASRTMSAAIASELQCTITTETDNDRGTFGYRIALSEDPSKYALFMLTGAAHLPDVSRLYNIFKAARVLANRMSVMALLADGSARVGLIQARQDENLAWHADDSGETTLLISASTGFDAFRSVVPGIADVDAIIVSHFIR